MALFFVSQKGKLNNSERNQRAPLEIVEIIELLYSGSTCASMGYLAMTGNAIFGV
jgi:hypothetical protein